MSTMLANYPFFILYYVKAKVLWCSNYNFKKYLQEWHTGTASETCKDEEKCAIMKRLTHKGAVISEPNIPAYYNFVTKQYVEFDEQCNIKLHGELHIKPFFHNRSLMISAKYYNTETKNTVEFKDAVVKMDKYYAHISSDGIVFRQSGPPVQYEDPVQQFVSSLIRTVCRDEIITKEYRHSPFIDAVLQGRDKEVYGDDYDTPDSLTVETDAVLSLMESQIKIVDTESYDTYTTTVRKYRSIKFEVSDVIMAYDLLTSECELIYKFIDDFLYTYATKKNAKGVHTQELTYKYYEDYYALGHLLLTHVLFGDKCLNDPMPELTFGDCDKIQQLLYIKTAETNAENEDFCTLCVRRLDVEDDD